VKKISGQPFRAAVKMIVMMQNSTQRRCEVSEWAEKAAAKKESEKPCAADVESLKGIWDSRKTPSILSASQVLPSSRDVVYGPEPDWNSWPSIAARFKAYYEALVEIDNKSSSALAEMRLRGV
jgi:hypothetical protein